MINPRTERIEKLKAKLSRIQNALTNYRYTNKNHILEDFVAFTETEKEIQIQEAYYLLELKHNEGSLIL